LKDQQGKKIRLHELSYITGIDSLNLLEILGKKKGFGIKKAVYLSMLCEQYGYDFPVETFINSQDLKMINHILEKKCGIRLEPYNPLVENGYEKNQSNR